MYWRKPLLHQPGGGEDLRGSMWKRPSLNSNPLWHTNPPVLQHRFRKPIVGSTSKFGNLYYRLYDILDDIWIIKIAQLILSCQSWIRTPQSDVELKGWKCIKWNDYCFSRGLTWFIRFIKINLFYQQPMAICIILNTIISWKTIAVT